MLVATNFVDNFFKIADIQVSNKLEHFKQEHIEIINFYLINK